MEQVETGFILDAIKRELELSDWEKDFMNDGIESRRVYLGTVFALYPSGKYYMPWACSNLDVCNDCNGSGQELTLRSILQGVKQAIRWTFTRTYYTIKRGEWKLSIYRNIAYLHASCGNCGGTGSREAYLDQLWREQVELELDTIGAYLESGEGDPCDLFATQSRDIVS